MCWLTGTASEVASVVVGAGMRASLEASSAWYDEVGPSFLPSVDSGRLNAIGRVITIA